MAEQYERFGKHVLLEKLAMGGMAEVYLAKAPSHGGISKFVAIKRILPQFSDNPDFIDMFKDEAKIAINLNHSNIVSIYEFGVEKKQFFLVMDYVEGKNLRQILNKLKKTNQQLTMEQALYVVKEVANGLDNAHRCLDGATGRPLNITHRDMSPQNVMVSFEGEIKIVDFGIAKAESQLETTRAGTLKGKFGYMSPEQAEGLNVDLRTDIFSLGIVLWELLASDRLFVANNEINTLRKIRDCQIPSLRKINPNIPQELDRIVSKALARDRNLRYQTAAAFQKDLSRFLNRQYPDFSPHDFSVFVKTLFSNEILENRKRLIEYAKIPFGDQSATEEQTEITETVTDTRSVSKTASLSSPAQRLKSKQKKAPSNLLDEANAKVNFQNLEVNRKDLIRKTIELSSTSERSLKTELDGTANTNVHTNIYSPTKTNTMDTGFTPIPTITRRSSKSSGGGFFKAILFAGALFVAYLYVESNFPELLSGTKDISSKSEEEDFFPDENQDTTAPAAVNTYGLLVQSKPSGAEIYLNDQNTGVTTPGVIRVPQKEAFSLDVRKVGYLPQGGRYSSTGNGQEKSFVLQKALFGYLNINVTPPTAKIYIDDEKLSQNLPIRKYAVAAGKRITVTAIDPFTQQQASQLVVVDKDKTKTVNLVLKKKRRPSATRRKSSRSRR